MTSVPLHENRSVLDYLSSRYFTGFQLKAEENRIALLSTDGTIQAILSRAKFTGDDDDQIAIDVEPLVNKRIAIKKAVRDLRLMYDNEANDLLEALNTIHSFCDPAVQERLAEGFIMFGDVPVLFPRGMEVVCQENGSLLGGVIESCTEMQTFSGTFYAVALLCLIPTSKGPALGKVVHRVPYFDAAMAVRKLSVRPISSTEKAQLTERGRIFNTFTANGPSPAQYTGTLTIPTWFRDRTLGATGRVMVDAGNFAQVDADLYSEMMRQFSIEDDAHEAEYGREVPEQDLWRCYHRVQGFSMRLKRWGWMDVAGLNHVVWRDNAFEQLVLEPERKNLVFNLVKHYGNSFSDFVDDKSGGLVFLLHGVPGTGKTLTAEAVAEALRRPLYSVSAGELGTTPESMEEKLRLILDLAYQWNAVLLLDEADVFMQARDLQNVERNALVTIFLRQLEYYSGVMFLTTNRVTSFDPAFVSRISLGINYPRLEAEDRRSVWSNVLTAAKVEVGASAIREVAQRPANGRNIKTAVRLAQTLAAGEGRSVVGSDLHKVLTFTEDFSEMIDAPVHNP